MNLSSFIAARVASELQTSFSALIIRIAVAAVALSMTIMICATALASGFKSTISEKVFDFWGHIHITNYDSNNSLESIPIDAKQSFYPYLDTVRSIDNNYKISLFGKTIDRERKTKGGIRHIQMFANKGGIIKTKTQLEGIVLKGVGADFDWRYMKRFLVAGDTLALKNWTFMPNYLANKYNSETAAHDKKQADSINYPSLPRDFLNKKNKIVDEFAALRPYADTAASTEIIISESTSKRLNVGLNDAFTVHFVEGELQRIRKFRIKGIYKTGLEEYDRKFALVDLRQVQELNNWSPNQISGFEISLENIADLDAYGQYVYYRQTNSDLFSQTIKELYPNIFGWLKLQDVNEQFVLFLMILVSVINMVTAMLILILERTNMIGTLKALGSDNWTIQKVFLYYAGLIVGRGLFFGNLIGVGLCLLQQYFGIIRLDEEAYYVAIAPIQLNSITILLLNLGTLVVTLLVLLVPSLLVARISPVKAIRFK